MVDTDNIRFLMPSQREYQYAAMAVVQAFVNGYANRCKVTDVSEGAVTYAMHYELMMREHDLAWFEACGLKLDSAPQRGLAIDSISMDIDLTDDRLERFRTSGKHITQACGLMCGVLCPALPVVRGAALRTGDWVWLTSPDEDTVAAIKDNEVTGVVGLAGPATYLAAARGLAVVEWTAQLDSPNWLTKWQNILYRRIEITEAYDKIRVMVARAKENIEVTIQTLLEAKQEALRVERLREQ